MANNLHRWTRENIPDQTGRVAIVTGGNTGLGYATALALVGAGAEVVIAARNSAKAAEAIKRIRTIYPNGHVSFAHLDLASMASVREFAALMCSRFPAIDLLINNAGIASPRERLTSVDGFELQMATNYLGHFLLTAGLLDRLRQAAAPRVVNLSSIMHKYGRIDFDDLMSERRYSPVQSYSQSKLATLIFTQTLQRHSDAEGWGLLSVASHPGIARTELTKSRPGQQALRLNALMDLLSPLFAGTASGGALPTLFAATAPDVEPAGYYGPSGWGEIKGPPGTAMRTPASRDPEVGARLWAVAEHLTGTKM
jgi:NAD(P)-dependent dehydrogenase (short-subunit alcohol dehydrogenase family)